MSLNRGLICQVDMHDGKPCGRTFYNIREPKCVFHSRLIEDKTEKFIEELKTYISDVETNQNINCYDFTNFLFPQLDFGKKVFSKPVFFFGSVFYENANFTSAKFTEKVDFRAARFLKRGEFSYAIFESEVDFWVTEFVGLCDFIETKFKNNVKFFATKFQSQALLIKCAFEGNLDFSMATFKETATFSNSIFNGIANFNGITFQKGASFGDVEFNEEVDFRSANFSDRTTYHKTKFKKFCSFFRAHISGKIFFENTHFDCLDFRKVVCERMAEVQFFEADLTKASFLDTDLGKIDFENANWDRGITTLFGPRQRIYDEKLTVDAETLAIFNELVDEDEKYECNLPSLENLYRQLKKKYDQKAHYRAAGDFHKGEMEVIRKRTRGSNLISFDRVDLIVSSIYKRLSYYGENYIFTAIWIFVTAFILLPVGFMFTGLAPDAEFKKTEQSFKYFITCRPNITAGEILDDYSGSLLFTLRTFFFQKEGIFHPQDRYGHYLVFGARIFSAVLLAFFLLAIRRRFKR